MEIIHLVVNNHNNVILELYGTLQHPEIPSLGPIGTDRNYLLHFLMETQTFREVILSAISGWQSQNAQPGLLTAVHSTFFRTLKRRLCNTNLFLF